jgi:hypothetical protein
MSPRAVRSLLLALGAFVAVWSGSAVIAGLYYVAQGKYVNGVMLGTLLLGTALFLGSLAVLHRGWQMRPREEQPESGIESDSDVGRP